MTSELEQDMTKVAEGTDTQNQVVYHSRALLAGMLDALIEHKDDLVFLDIRTERETNVYPMVAAGKGLSEIIMAEPL